MSAAIDGLLARGVDRILYGTTGGKKVHLARALRGRAVVLMNCFDEASPLPAVLPDEYAAGGLAADTLLGGGHSDQIWLGGGDLSSIELSHFDIGRRAVEILLDDRTASGTHTVPMPLNARARSQLHPPTPPARSWSSQGDRASAR